MLTVALDTWKALLAPRRSVPIVALCVPMIIAQAAFGDSAAAWLGVAMCVGFVVVGPLAWRLCVPRGASLPRRVAGFAVYVVIGAVPALLGDLIPRQLDMGITFLTGGVNLIVVAALFWVGGWGLARDIEREQELDEARERADTLARQAEQARLMALRANLDPHFLFNTLNAIAEWCREDGEVAEAAVLKLAGMLRDVLEGTGPELWPLEREVGLCRDLFELHRIRDPEALEFSVELPPELRDWPVPPMLLLPVAENAMTHGPRAGHAGPVCLRVEADALLRVIIENPGAFTGRRVGGEGLAMVERRLELAGGQFHIEAVGDRTRATVSLPRR